MKHWNKYVGSRDTAKTLVSVLATSSAAPGTAPSATTFSRRRLLARLGLLTATIAAAPALAAQPPRPRCDKGAEQLMALREYEKALAALPSEADSPVLKDLHERYSKLRIQKKMIPATRLDPVTRARHTVNMAVFQTGKVGADRIAVLIHGCLADHETWRYIAATLGEDHELWMLDLPGCGESDGHPDHLESDAFTPAALAERVGIVLEQCLKQCLADRAALCRPAPRLTLVGHSLGGTISLRLLSTPELRNRFAGVRQHLDALVLFAPCDVAVNCLPPSFLPLLSLTPVKVGVGRALGVVDDKVKALTRKSYFLPECATREQAEHFMGALAKPAHLRSNQAMVRGAVPWKMKENRPDWPAIVRLETNYTNVDVPCLIAWGKWDETLTETMGHKIRDYVPGARLVEITHAGHSVMSEQPLACAHIIRTGQAEVEGGRFAALPSVCSYGTKPFDGPFTVAT
jgi:pimeloyl-ACP methyl ester carboxylesterase